MTSNVNNQGIAHVAFKAGGLPLCRNRRGHFSVSIAQYRANREARYCARCEANLAEMDERKAQESKAAMSPPAILKSKNGRFKGIFPTEAWRDAALQSYQADGWKFFVTFQQKGYAGLWGIKKTEWQNDDSPVCIKESNIGILLHREFAALLRKSKMLQSA